MQLREAKHLGRLFAIIGVHLNLAPLMAADSRTLTSGHWAMLNATRGAILIALDNKSVAEVNPLIADVIDTDGKIVRLVGTYENIEHVDKKLRAQGSLTTASGTVLGFSDVIEVSLDPGSFQVDRTVTVAHADVTDKGFRTEWAVRNVAAQNLAEVQPFVPGMWYCDATHVPASGLISNPSQKNYLFREDRLPLPLAMVRERASGMSICLIHSHPDGATFPAENTADTVIDERMQFGSLGVIQDGGIGVAMAFPGVETDLSRVGKKPGHPATQRFHPVREGFSQHWTVVIHLANTSDFDDAMHDAWRTAYADFSPQIVKVSMEKVYSVSIDLLDHYGTAHHGVMGFPFAVTLPDGTVRDVSYQMGFVGEQIPCAAHLINAGFSRSRPDLVQKGEQIVNFWASNCLTPSGLPRTWYDVDPKPHWRNYKTFTRIATDGMEGMLQAWRRMKLNSRDKPEWLACCRKFGDWLVEFQNADGSYYRQYNDDNSPAFDSKSAALHPVRFLIDLTNATGDERYLEAAKRAGHFGMHDIGGNTNYYGGTADNNDVKDKEAGWIALDSYLALYEATHDRVWLVPAVHAATFTESWTYGWNVPVDRADSSNGKASRTTFPSIKTTAGMSLIATGHSGADVFLAFAPYAYYRLWLYTGDEHFAAVARLLLYNTRQLVDIDGSLGYATSGLLTEAFSLAPPRGSGVNTWLPWCTAAVLDPMQQFQDTFQSMDVEEIERMPVDKQKQMLAQFADRHGFPRLTR